MPSRSLLSLSLLAAVALAGCSKASRPLGSEPSASARAAAPASAPGAVHATAALTGPSTVRVGAMLELTAEFVARDGYHCNREYPSSFTPDAAPEGVAFAAPKFSEVSWGDARSTLAVSLSATTPGTRTISGMLKFGICDAAECIPVKLPVTFRFDAI